MTPRERILAVLDCRPVDRLPVDLWHTLEIGAMWFLAFCVVIMVIPRLLLSLALVSGHTWGTMTWLVNRVGLNYHLCLLFFVLSATVYILFLRKSGGPGTIVRAPDFSRWH